MSVPITDKADNMSKLVDNLNVITNEVNEQLDPSVLANLTTKVKDTLVNAINELNRTKISSEGDITFLGDIIAKSFSAKNYEVGFDENGNSYIDFIDAKTNAKVHFGWKLKNIIFHCATPFCYNPRYDFCIWSSCFNSFDKPELMICPTSTIYAR